MAQKIRLGDLLVQNSIISPAQLQTALDEQKKTGLKLGKVLTNLGFITEDTLLSFLSKQLNLPLINLKRFDLDPALVKLLPENYARRFRAIILKKQDGGLLVGTADPLDFTILDELRRVLQQSVYFAIVRESDLLHALDLSYRRTEEISGLAEQLSEEIAKDAVEFTEAEASTEPTDAPIIKLLHSLFEDAVQVHASDIHIEPDEKVLRIRLRIDGILHEQVVKEKQIATAIALRLKLMSGLNIAEKRLPQDGRFNIKVRNKPIDVRLSTLPSQHGESVVMRLLDQSEGLSDLGRIGMSPAMLERFRKLLKSPHGIILVTGPTGSGKSTTLYGALTELNSAEDKIITVEDPVEYRLPRVTQVQINPVIDLSFARVLRTTLRQDPDIIMVGEMRDPETASIAVRAALTGHLVLSTLHTNDSASSAFRLVDMSVEGFLVAATLRGVLAQRLARCICESCSTDYEPTPAEQNWLESISKKTLVKKAAFKYGKGCAYCNHTGYKGRTGVFELLELNSLMINALRRNDPSQFALEAESALKNSLLLDHALELSYQGKTTLSEVMRIAGEI